ncbi:MAG: PQQ-binding-like beta-propeller repeat protein, partial [Planctomycetaceae bacterium]
MNKNSCLMTGSCLLLCWLIDPVAADWPMWRADAGRTGVAREAAPETPALRWLRKLPALTPAFRSPRLQFDAGYEPIVSGGLVIAGSSRNDSVTAFDAQSGEQRWQFFTEGPVRFAPVAWRDRVFFGSDDGCVYCLEIQSGKELWKRRAVPSQRKILGNRRLISVWPVRGGPVVADERLYFAAGVWPMEGIVVYCLDALSGETIWL